MRMVLHAAVVCAVVSSLSGCAGRPIRTEVIATEISNRVLIAPPGGARARGGIGQVREGVRRLQDQLRAEKRAKDRREEPVALGTSGSSASGDPQPTASTGTMASSPGVRADPAAPDAAPGHAVDTHRASPQVRGTLRRRIAIPAAILLLAGAFLLLRHYRRA